MKKNAYITITVILVFSLFAAGVFAQRGRGGGGRVGGGARSSISRGPSMSRPSVSRSPSMSRPSVSRPSTGSISRPSVSRPSTGSISRPSVSQPSVSRPSITRPSVSRPSVSQPSIGSRPSVQPGQRPTQGQLQNFLNLPKPGSGAGRPAAGTLPSTGTRPGAGTLPSTGTRPGGGGNIGNRPINVNRPQINQQVNNRYRNIQNRPFTPSWRPPAAHLPAHRWHPWNRYSRFGHGHWWRWATAAAVTRWVVYGWARPFYYSYGTGGTVYYEGDTVYVNGQQSCTAEEYYQQATDIAGSIPEISDGKADQVEWMPLGVFAVTQEGVDETNMLLQLAVSKEGMIAGTLFNESTDSARPVEGMVDNETQRAVWSFADGKNTDVVMETGIYSLTENEATALVHFGAGQTQTSVLVRLDEPEEPEQ